MRYSINVNSWCGKAKTLDKALAMMSQKMFINRSEAKTYVEDTGVVQAAYGFTTGQIVDHEWTDPKLVSHKAIARQQVLELYGEDGVLEVDEDATVSTAECGYQVQVWVWVSDEDAGADSEASSEGEMSVRYVAAAEHPVAEFDGEAIVSMGDDDGAYVSGWIHIGLDPDIFPELAQTA